MDNGQKRKIAHGVFLYKSKKTNMTNNTESYYFKVTVEALKIVEVECDFTGSINVAIKEPPSSTLTCTQIVQPFQEPTTVAHLELSPEWRLKSVLRLTFKSPSKETQLQWIEGETKSLKAEIKLIEALFRSLEVSLLSLQEIEAELAPSKLLYIDLDFLPVQMSILGKEDRTLLDDTLTHWRRPKVFFGQTPFSVCNKIQPNTLESGKLGHQAFYSVVRCLAHKPALIERIFAASSQVNPNSIYILTLCNNGQMQSIFIDDFIPCEPIQNPKFIKSSGNQIWPCLIEKAYAKTFNNYFSLRELEVQDVFEDLTGCPTHVRSIEFTENQLNKLSEELKSGFIVSLYTVEETREFEQDDFNPRANRAYLLLSVKPDHKQISVSTQNGVLAMAIQQARGKFKQVCVCDISHWYQTRIKGKFIKVQHSKDPDQINIMSKWCYNFDLHQKTEMSFCLHQEDIHVGDNNLYKPYMWISMILFKREHSSILTPLTITEFGNKRSTYINITLQQGSYILLPITISELKSTIQLSEKQLVYDIFRKLDLLLSRELKYNEIKTLCNHVKEPIDQQKYQYWLKKYTKLKGFGFSAFKRLWNDYRVSWKPNIAQFSMQRVFVLSFHSKKQMEILVKDAMGTDLDNRSHVAAIRKFGEEIKTKYKEVKFYRLKQLVKNPVTYFIENISTSPIEIELDCSKSNGYSFVPTSGKVKRRLGISQYEYIMQMIPDMNGSINAFTQREELRVSQAI